MTDLQSFIKNRDLELTLSNEHNEHVYAGTATDISHKKNHHLVRFSIRENPKNLLPLTLATLHSGTKIFSTFYIKPIYDNRSLRTIEVKYSD